MGSRRIGEILVAEGLLSEAAVQRALGFQRSNADRIKLGSILLEWDLLAEETLLESLAKLHRCPAVPWETLAATSIEVVRLLPATHAIRLDAMPYSVEKGTVRVAFVNPSNLAVLDEASAITGKRVAPGVTTEVRLMQAHQRFYGRHIPLEFRSIVQRLGRETQRRRLSSARTGLVSPPADREGRSPAPSPQISSPSDADTAETLSIEIPEIPLPTRAPRPIPLSADWVGDALTSFRGESTSLLDPRRDSFVSAGAPAPEASNQRAPSSPLFPWLPLASATPQAAIPLSTEDSVAAMWRPAPPPPGEPDAFASDMWSAAERESRPRSLEARSREEIGDAILDSFLTEIPRVILLGVGRASIAGWRGRGPGLSADRVEGLRIPSAEKSLFAGVAESGVPHFGPVARYLWPRVLGDLLGESPLDCAVFPVRVLDGVAAFLYADRVGEPMRSEDFPVIARAAASASNVLSRFLLRHSGTAPVG